MNGNGWTKFFEDGTELIGLDGKSSWSKSKLENMVGVEVRYDGVAIALFSDEVTDYHQSDDYEMLIVGDRKPKMIARRIQKRLPDGLWYTMELDLTTGQVIKYTSECKI